MSAKKCTQRDANLKRRKIIIDRSAEVINEVEKLARSRGFKRTPNFLLHCATSAASSVDIETSIAIGQMNRKLNSLVTALSRSEIELPELTTSIAQMSSQLRKLPRQIRRRS